MLVARELRESRDFLSPIFVARCRRSVVIAPHFLVTFFCYMRILP